MPVVSVNEPPHYELVRDLQGPHGDLLIVIAGTRTGDQFTLMHEETTVGRDESCQILLDDVSVSRHHGVFTRTASGRMALRDLNSLNGTYVNGRRVEEVILKSGDEVQIGKFKLVFWEATP